MKIGYACIPLCIDARTTRTFLLKNFSKETFFTTTISNLNDLEKILYYNISKNIKLFRISSNIIPFGSHKINTFKWWDIFENELKYIGNIIKENNIRVSMHPGQYTVLNSPSKDIVKKSISDIEYHTKFLDSLNLDYTNKIILHIGGIYNDKTSAINRFINNFYSLSDSAKKRLVIENDEKNYTIDDILFVCSKINIPAVFDILHHKYNNTQNRNLKNIFNNIRKTWGYNDGTIKIHYSNSNPYKKMGAHSDFLYTIEFIDYIKTIKNLTLNIDIMLEIKDKDISAMKALNVLNNVNNKNTIYKELAKYKYNLKERNPLYYKKCINIINKKQNIIDFYVLLDSYLIKPINKKYFLNTFSEIIDLLKPHIKNREEKTLEQYFFKCNEFLNERFLNNDTLVTHSKNYIYKLSKKYNISNIKNSYYFFY